jgi:BlaI family transcriptional regulator, penicillinase repressor
MTRTSSSREIPPPLELACLKALWHIGEGTVKDVRGVVTERRNLAYTTVMTVLDRLEKRGSVQRKKIGRSFVYTPVLEKSDLRRLAVNSLVDMFFEGSREELIRFLEEAESPARASEETVVQRVETEVIDTDLL